MNLHDVLFEVVCPLSLDIAFLMASLPSFILADLHELEDVDEGMLVDGKKRG